MDLVGAHGFALCTVALLLPCKHKKISIKDSMLFLPEGCSFEAKCSTRLGSFQGDTKGAAKMARAVSRTLIHSASFTSAANQVT
jgi:hypothetical protein